jgi:acyl carrier protein
MTADTAASDNRGTVVDAITEAIRAVLRTELGEVAESTRLIQDLGMDSSAVFGLLLELEDALGFQVDTDILELRDLATVGSLADFVAKCRSA